MIIYSAGKWARLALAQRARSVPVSIGHEGPSIPAATRRRRLLAGNPVEIGTDVRPDVAGRLGGVNAVTARRWADDQGTVWFAARLIDATCEQVAERVLMDYERAGPEWRRGYPGDTPHLERAWENFSACIDRVLRQAARLEPVPWRDALRELCQRTVGQPVSWWLAGSTALAVRGAPIEAGDLDVVCTAGDAVTLGELFSDSLIEPVTTGSADWLGQWLGRAFWGARIEWVGGVNPLVDDPEPCDFGPEAARRLEPVQFEDWQILVPPLDLQRAVNQRRGLTHRVAMIDALAGLSPAGRQQALRKPRIGREGHGEATPLEPPVLSSDGIVLFGAADHQRLRSAG